MLWIKRIIITIAMVIAFACSIAAFWTDSKTTAFILLNILLLFLPALNVVLYFAADDDPSWLAFFVRCIQCGLEFFLASNYEASWHGVGGLVTAVTLVPMALPLIFKFLDKAGGDGTPRTYTPRTYMYQCIKCGLTVNTSKGKPASGTCSMNGNFGHIWDRVAEV